jgi:hypothetical protein
MDNVKVIEVTQIEGTIIEMVEIELPDGGLVSMTKEEYDRQQVEHLTEIVPANE